MLPTSHSLDAARTLIATSNPGSGTRWCPSDQYEVITPKLFQHHLFTKARRIPNDRAPCVVKFRAPHAIDATCFLTLLTQVLPEGNDRGSSSRPVSCEKNLVELIILGNRDEILAIAEEAGVVISGRPRRTLP